MDESSNQRVEGTVLYSDDNRTTLIKGNQQLVSVINHLETLDDRQAFSEAYDGIVKTLQQLELASFLQGRVLSDGTKMQIVSSLPFVTMLSGEHLSQLSTGKIINKVIALLRDLSTAYENDVCFSVNQQNIVFANEQLYILDFGHGRAKEKDHDVAREIGIMLHHALTGHAEDATTFSNRDLPQGLHNVLDKASRGGISSYGSLDEFKKALESSTASMNLSTEDDFPSEFSEFAEMIDEIFSDQPEESMDFDSTAENPVDMYNETRKKGKNTVVGVMVTIAILVGFGSILFKYVMPISEPELTIKPTIVEEIAPTEEADGSEWEDSEEYAALEAEYALISQGLENSFFYYDAAIEGFALNRFADSQADYVYFRYVAEAYYGLAKMKLGTEELTIISEEVAPFNIIVADDWIYYADQLALYSICRMSLDGSTVEKLPYSATTFDMLDNQTIVFADLKNGNRLTKVNIETNEILVLDDSSIVQDIKVASDGSIFYSGMDCGMRELNSSTGNINIFSEEPVSMFDVDETSNTLVYVTFGYAEADDTLVEAGPLFIVDLNSREETNLGKMASYLLAIDDGIIFYSGEETEFVMQTMDYAGNELGPLFPDDEYILWYYRVADDGRYYSKGNGRLYSEVDGKEYLLPGLDYEALYGSEEIEEKSAE